MNITETGYYRARNGEYVVVDFIREADHLFTVFGVISNIPSVWTKQGYSALTERSGLDLVEFIGKELKTANISSGCVLYRDRQQLGVFVTANRFTKEQFTKFFSYEFLGFVDC